eukprot:143562-Lingulodinium_polyedra.AAC.1
MDGEPAVAVSRETAAQRGGRSGDEGVVPSRARGVRANMARCGRAPAPVQGAQPHPTTAPDRLFQRGE